MRRHLRIVADDEEFDEDEPVILEPDVADDPSLYPDERVQKWAA